DRDATLTEPELRADCSETFEACIAENPVFPQSGCEDFSPTCHATVAEISACFNDWVDFLQRRQAAAPACEAVTRASLAQELAADGSFTSAACLTAQQKCPDDIHVLSEAMTSSAL